MFDVIAERIRNMAYREKTLNAEEAKKKITQFQYALIYMISELILKKTVDLNQINWDECEEARFFSASGELHFFREDGNLQVVEISDNPDEDKMESMQKKYCLASRFRSLGKYVLVKEYLEYDADGQVHVVQTRLIGIE